METLSTINPFEIYKAQTMLSNSDLPRSVDALFFFGRSFGDENGLFGLAGKLYSKNKVKYIIFPDTEGEKEGGTIPGEANRGKTAYTGDLVSLGVSRNDILYGGPGKNTKTEGDGFLNRSKKKGFSSAAVLTQPHQILRAMLGLIKSMEKQDFWMYVYPVVTTFTPWHEQVFGSQGALKKTREDHIYEEYVRILRYQNQGDLASFPELFNYLQRRDSNQLA